MSLVSLTIRPPHVLKRAGAILALLVPVLAGGAQDAADRNPLDGFLDVLQSQGYDVRAPAAWPALVEGAARSFDSGARFLDEAAHVQWVSGMEGKGWRPDIQVRISNGVFRISGSGLDAEALQRIGRPLVDEPVLPDLFRRLRGDLAEPVVLEMADASGLIHTVGVDRVLGKLDPVPLVETWPEEMGYVLVQGLYAGSGQVVAEQLLAWNTDGLSGAIVDLRGAGGGDLESVRILAGLFAHEQATLFTLIPLGGDPDRVFTRPEKTAFLNLPVMVLVDNATTGAAELFAAACRGGLRGAMLLGQTTAGNFCLRTALDLPRGGHLLVATHRLVTADGTGYLGGTGLVPDIQVDTGGVLTGPLESEARAGRTTLDTEENHLFIRQRVGRDPVLGRAADLLLGLKALNIRSLAQPSNHNP